jgi:hypothetical protein
MPCGSLVVVAKGEVVVAMEYYTARKGREAVGHREMVEVSHMAEGRTSLGEATVSGWQMTMQQWDHWVLLEQVRNRQV